MRISGTEVSSVILKVAKQSNLKGEGIELRSQLTQQKYYGEPCQKWTVFSLSFSS